MDASVREYIDEVDIAALDGPCRVAALFGKPEFFAGVAGTDGVEIADCPKVDPAGPLQRRQDGQMHEAGHRTGADDQGSWRRSSRLYGRHSAIGRQFRHRFEARAQARL